MFKIDKNIVEYETDMAAKVADMFNKFAELWPGGFGGGIPYDEERVKDRLDETPALADLIALDDDEKPVGFCGLYPHWRESDAAYINLLGVVPRVKGQKFGKNLLLKALKIATENDIKRVDLHTWSGNLDAVPLYKKIGMFWVPETSVYMQDFIPGIMTLPICEEWFKEHPDWYSNFERELKQTQDDIEIDGMKSYKYRFEDGGDHLEIEVDRFGWDFKGINYKLGNTGFSIRTRLKSHEIFIGLENELIVEIENNTGKKKEIDIKSQGYEGLEWLGDENESLIVEDGEIKKATFEFIVDHDVERFDKDKPSQSIVSNISFGDREIELKTGGKIQPAIEVKSNESFHSTFGKEGKNIYFDIANKTEKEFSGYVKVNCKQYGLDGHNIDFELDPEEISGIEVSIKPHSDLEAHLYEMGLTPFVKHDDEYLQMPTYDHHILVENDDMLVNFQHEDEQKAYLVSSKMKVEADLEGGKLSYFSREFEGEVEKQFRHEIGPPYGLSLDRTLEYDCELNENSEYKILKLIGESNHLPGIRIEKNVKLEKNQGMMEHWIELRNITEDEKIEVGCKFDRQFYGLRLNSYSGKGKAYTPLRSGIIECDNVMNVMSNNMVTKDPSEWMESWTAVKCLANGDYTAVIWQDKNIEKVKVGKGMLSELETSTELLKPGETFTSPHIWYHENLPTLYTVRNKWNELVNKEEDFDKKIDKPIKTKKPIEMKIDGINLISRNEKQRITIDVDYATPYEFDGEVTLYAPDGIEASLIEDDQEVKEIKLGGFDPDETFSFDIEAIVDDDFERSVTNLNLHVSSEFEMDFGLPLLIKGGSEIKTQEKIIEDNEVLEVTNGYMNYKVPKDIGGNLIDFKDTDKKTYLVDNFPEIKPRYFFEKNIGGITPHFFEKSEDDPFKEPEKVEVKEHREGDWKGVEAKMVIRKSEKLKGQVFLIRYLTIPDTNLIKVSIKHENPTKRKIDTVSLIRIDTLLGSDIKESKIQVHGDDKVWTKNKTDTMFSPQSNIKEPWLRIFNEDQSIVFFIPEGKRGSVGYLDTQDLMFSFMLSREKIEPESETVTEFGLAIDVEKDEIDLLRDLLRSI